MDRLGICPREANQYVLRLDVAVDDPRLVGVLEGVAELDDDGGADLGGHLAVLLQDLSECHAAHELDDTS
jgi:hypothetical protein